MPSFYDQLKSGQFENFTSDPSNLPTGRFWLRTDTTPPELKYYDGANTIKVVGTTLAQTLTNKTITIGSSSGKVLIGDGSNNISSETTLATTRGGLNIASYTTGDIIYASSSSVLAKLGIGTTGQTIKVVAGVPAWGTLAEVGGGTAQTSYTKGDVLHATASNTLGKLGIGSTGQVLTVVAGDTAWATPTQSSAIASKTNSDSPYTALAGDDLIFIDTSGGAVTVNLPTAASIGGKIYTVVKTTSDTSLVTVDANSTETINGALTFKLCTQYELVRVISDGTNWQVIGHTYPSKWIAFTPTCSLSTNAGTPTGFWRRVGDSIQVQVKVSLTGANTQGNVTFTIPNNAAWTVDTAKLVGSTNVSDAWIGSAIVKRGSVFNGHVAYSSTTTVVITVQLVDNGTTNYALNSAVNTSTNVPGTFANTDFIAGTFLVPITNFEG